MFSRLISRWAQPLSRRRMQLVCAACALGLAVALGLCTWCSSFFARCDALRADTLRLHVRAASDSVLDQTVKLRVRDAVLELAGQLCCESATKDEALRCAARNLVRFQLAAQHALAGLHTAVPVRVQLTNMYFATTEYDGFALPAGRYDAVRIELGRTLGRNWWCVLYPGLCLAACGGYSDPAENDLTIGDHIVRFRVVEWWQARTAPQDDRPLLALG